MRPFDDGRRLAKVSAIAIAAFTVPASANADNPACAAITAAQLEIMAVDCNQSGVWSQLQASGQFPDVFAGSGKKTNLCYVATGPAPATIGGDPVTIASSISGWTTDFTPGLFGGPDNLGTVVTQLTISGLNGQASANLFTRDTIDLSQIFTTGTASEEDVIVGGSGPLENAKGTYRVASVPEDPFASKVLLTNLAGVLCTH